MVYPERLVPRGVEGGRRASARKIFSLRLNFVMETNAWPRAILLDFYGTVVEEDDAPIAAICREIADLSPMQVTAREVAACWNQIFSERCNESHGDKFQLQRELERLSLDNLLLHFNATLDGERLSETLYEYWAHPAIFPESRRAIAEWNVPICLVTNIDNKDITSALKHTGLHFNSVVTSEDCRAYKPRPELFQRALSLLGLSAAEVLHIGDSLASDIQGAKNLGIPTLWVNRKKRPSSPDFLPDYESASLGGIFDLLRKR